MPGSGKGYQVAKRYPNYTVISSDNIIEQLSLAEGMTYDQGFKKFVGRATGEMKSAFKRAVSNNENIVWDQTNLSKKKRRGILQQVPNHYSVVALVLDVDERVRQQRAAGRAGKSIPDHVIKSMFKSYQTPTKDEGFDQIITVKE